MSNNSDDEMQFRLGDSVDIRRIVHVNGVFATVLVSSELISVIH